MPTGLVAYNDLAAIGVLRALRAAGIGVPASVSVIGFDDIEPASWTDPPLTTIRQPTAEMGRWAVDRIASALHGMGETSRQTLAPELVVRGSTAPPPPDAG
jgi:DNA-binding LacI/PurR family transcriptional regulator